MVSGLVRRAGLEPARCKPSVDSKSTASTNFAIYGYNESVVSVIALSFGFRAGAALEDTSARLGIMIRRIAPVSEFTASVGCPSLPVTLDLGSICLHDIPRKLEVIWEAGLEPATSRFQSAHANQLRYSPVYWCGRLELHQSI